MRKSFAYILSLIFLASCSLSSLVIWNLDHFITNRINRSLELNSYQKKELLTDVRFFLEKAKPKIQLLESRITQLDLDNTTVQAEFKFLNSVYFDVAKSFTPILAKRIVQFDKEKLNHFFEDLETQNTKIENEIKEKEIDDYLDRYKYFFGDLSEQQIINIKSSIPIYKSISTERVTQRRKLQKKLKSIVYEDKSLNKEMAITKLFNQYSDRRVPTKTVNKALDKIHQFVKEASPSQKEQLKSRLSAFKLWIINYLEEKY